VSAAEAVESFLDAKSHLRPATRDTYRQQLEAWLKTAPTGVMLRDVRADHLRSYVMQSDIAASSKRKRYRHLRAFLNWAVDEKHIETSPLEDLPEPNAEKKRPDYLTPDDLERLLIAIDHHEETTEDAAGRTPDVQWLRDIIQIGVCTGLRRREVVNLHWSDIDLKNGFVTVRNRQDFRSKSGHERTIPLRGDALHVIERRSAEREEESDGPVVVDRRGLPIKPDRISSRFKFFVRLAKLDDRIHFHSLRHTCATWLAMKGVPLRIIQAILGHSTIQMVEQYSHFMPEVMTRAMEETFG
jgi:integrase